MSEPTKIETLVKVVASAELTEEIEKELKEEDKAVASILESQ